MPRERIPSSRTSKCAGIEIGVEAMEAFARAIRHESGPVPLSTEQRGELSYQALFRALELQKRATRALRGEKW